MDSDLARPGYREAYLAVVREKLVAASPATPAGTAAAIVSVLGLDRILEAPSFLVALADELTAHGRDDLAGLVRQVEEADLREASAIESRATVRLWPRSASLRVARSQVLRKAVVDLSRARHLRGEYVPVARISSPARPTRREPRARRTVRTSRGQPDPSEPPRSRNSGGLVAGAA